MKRLPALAVTGFLAACTARPSAVAPTAPPPPVGTPATAVAPLPGRPLHLPTVAPGADCPVTRPRPLAAGQSIYTDNVFGAGPLYPMPLAFGPDTTLRLTGQDPGTGGRYGITLVWVSRGGYTGPAVLRVYRLDGPGRGRVRLDNDPAASRGDEVVLEVPDDPTSWPSSTFVPGPGCYAYEIDGSTFTDVIVFRVID